MARANTLERIFSVDYKSKIQPIVSVCKLGKGLENLIGPGGVAIDNSTGDIYVADYENSVKVFDCNGKIMLKFGDEDGEGKMFCPVGIGIPGERELEFDSPHGLTFDESNGEVYICDSENARIQILSKELTYKTQFGPEHLNFPTDVKLTEEFIYILDQSNPCLHLYNYNLILHKRIISGGYGSKLIYPYFFCIDNSNNILITDYSIMSSSRYISIFNCQFDLIHKISIPDPTGITVDNKGRVIAVCVGGLRLLNIF
ncbi:NHL repeat containing protein [Oopsacas minuta]|uniref:NHL repeat containing protein n=1 Tax=Oopsacas minuta TaxID=111878 RepID=A0AAV7JL35_9METZ|nr:NHL repeat containing protein [Oopsacas minuta]